MRLPSSLLRTITTARPSSFLHTAVKTTIATRKMSDTLKTAYKPGNMKFRNLGPSGLKVSLFSLGGMPPPPVCPLLPLLSRCSTITHPS